MTIGNKIYYGTLDALRDWMDSTKPEKTIQETAEFVASYSKAWKEIWGYADVFYVNADQVSKSPPAGEYLPKGSFMILGKKKFLKIRGALIPFFEK